MPGPWRIYKQNADGCFQKKKKRLENGEVFFIENFEIKKLDLVNVFFFIFDKIN